MVLDELQELIETLQTRIGVHASALQQNEALTRYALIDPMCEVWVGTRATRVRYWWSFVLPPGRLTMRYLVEMGNLG